MQKQKQINGWLCFRDMKTEQEVYIPLYDNEQAIVNEVHLDIRGIVKIRYMSNIPYNPERFKVRIYG